MRTTGVQADVSSTATEAVAYSTPLFRLFYHNDSHRGIYRLVEWSLRIEYMQKDAGLQTLGSLWTRGSSRCHQCVIASLFNTHFSFLSCLHQGSNMRDSRTQRQPLINTAIASYATEKVRRQRERQEEARRQIEAGVGGHRGKGGDLIQPFHSACHNGV